MYDAGLVQLTNAAESSEQAKVALADVEVKVNWADVEVVGLAGWLVIVVSGGAGVPAPARFARVIGRVDEQSRCIGGSDGLPWHRLEVWPPVVVGGVLRDEEALGEGPPTPKLVTSIPSMPVTASIPFPAGMSKAPRGRLSSRA